MCIVLVGETIEHLLGSLIVGLRLGLLVEKTVLLVDRSACILLLKCRFSLV
jgi:hypothetical protein